MAARILQGGRAAKDLLEVSKNGHASGFYLLDTDPSIEGVYKIRISGPEFSPFVNHIFILNIQFPSRFPFEPVSIVFQRPVPYHPNIDSNGRICLDLLKMPPGGTWRPTVSLMAVLDALLVLLREPNPDDPLMPDIVNAVSNALQTNGLLQAREFTTDPKEYWRRASGGKMTAYLAPPQEATIPTKDINVQDSEKDTSSSLLSLKRKRRCN